MTDTDFHVRRTALANRLASVGAELLEHTAGAAGALAAIPNTQPQQYAVAGDPKAIRALLPKADDVPARRMRKGDRPSAEDLEWEPDPDDLRRFTVLLMKGTYGLVEEFGHTFPHALDSYERVNVVEIIQGASRQDELTFTVDGVVMSSLEYIDFLHDQLASRQVANKAEVEEDPLVTVSRDVDGSLKFTPLRDFHVTDGMELFATPPATTGASAALRPTDDELWDATLRDRDAYHEWADKLADAIAKHFDVDIGEHSNQNLPWYEALQAIENAELVGASTVLTDERSMVSIDTHRLHDLLEGWYHSANASKLIAHIDQHVAREVAAQAVQVAVPFDFHAHLARQAAWSENTFGPGPRTKGVCDHIRKELLEIESDPLDLREWIDVVILGLDGAWRCGGTPDQIIAGITAKQTKNEGRTWPDWRTADPDKAIEHDRTFDAAPSPAKESK